MSVGMIAETDFRHSFLLEQFRGFYDEVIVLKRAVQRGGAGLEALPVEFPPEVRPPGRFQPETAPTESAPAVPPPPLPGPAAPSSDAPEPEATAESEAGTVPQPPSRERDMAEPVRRHLISVLEGQVPESRRRGGEYGVGYYRDAQYAMAALADEIFLTLDWPGREVWRGRLLEYELFGSYTAGETLFERVERLLKDRDPADGELAAVYLLALALGFRGKFRDADDGGQIEYYRRQLFGFLFQGRPDLDREDRRLFPEAYANTLTRDEGERLPYVRRWLWLMLAILAVFLLASVVIWQVFTADLAQEVADLLRRFGGWTR
ncbi:MAG: DotU family type IV/VI secretion system protein [Desulfococcaceae bacterium]